MNRIAIRGEASNCKYHSSGHLYFSLKDQSGTISCVMFAGNRKGLSFRMEDGLKVVVRGRVSVYERDGSYQLYAAKIELDGIGQLYLRYEQLKRELDEMGMFADEYKQPIPMFARRVGIVTAATGAAVRDIIQVSKRRNPYVQLILYPAQVQGIGAAESIVKGIETLDAMGLDVLIVGRGGGSIEDLWAFNEEIVARAAFQCQTPLISAVGHQTDTTIIDYVADLRAPTPSAAAELAVFEFDALQTQLQALEQKICSLTLYHIEGKHKILERLAMRLKYLSPLNQLKEKKKQAQYLQQRLSEQMQRQLLQKRHQLKLHTAKLDSLSPLKKLCGGYSYTSVNGVNLTSIEQVQIGDVIDIDVADGEMQASILAIKQVRREVLDVGGQQKENDEKQNR